MKYSFLQSKKENAAVQLFWPALIAKSYLRAQLSEPASRFLGLVVDGQPRFEENDGSYVLRALDAYVLCQPSETKSGIAARSCF